MKGIYAGYTFLEDVYVDGVDNYLAHPTYNLGKEVLVIGGGDDALDAARTALRLTGGNVTIVYRRTESEMPADPIMVDEARDEGIQFKFLSTPSGCQRLGWQARWHHHVSHAARCTRCDRKEEP